MIQAASKVANAPYRVFPPCTLGQSCPMLNTVCLLFLFPAVALLGPHPSKRKKQAQNYSTRMILYKIYREENFPNNIMEARKKKNQKHIAGKRNLFLFSNLYMRRKLIHQNTELYFYLYHSTLLESVTRHQ